jgi:periplasmic protein CpxP/Spy
MLITAHWQSLLSFTAITPLIVYSFPISDFKSLFYRNNQNQYSLASKIIADSSSAINQQQPYNLFQQLNLTREQEEKIRQIHYKYQEAIRKKKNSLTILQQQLSDMMVGTESVELIRAKNQQLVTLHQEIGALSFESMLATREILTPQQRQKFRELVNLQLAP